MSWQTYIDEHLMCDIDGNHLKAAAIVGHDGSVWAQSASFPQVNYYLELESCRIRSDLIWFSCGIVFDFSLLYYLFCLNFSLIWLRYR